MGLASSLDDLRRRLLDLTRRNRLLHLPSSARTVVRGVAARPAPLWRTVVDDGRTLRFLALEDADAEERARLEAARASARARGADDEGDLVVGDQDPRPATQGPALPAPPAADGATTPSSGPVGATGLQTSLDAEALTARLLKLERAARLHLEEQGANVLYLTLCAVHWHDGSAAPGAPPELSRAPLLFVPVALSRRSVGSRHTLRALDDDVVVNPCLEELLRRSTKATLPAFEPDEPGFDVVAWLSRAREAVESVPGWRFCDDVTVGLYSFAKFLLWRDLDPSTWPASAPLLDHPLVRLLLGAPAPDGALGPPASDAPPLDAVPAAQVGHVVDADASQAAVVAAARAGTSLAVDGPPGTGKSQTIANLIAGCLLDGKRVLFVAEKAAALDVVRRRLEAAGLADFLLELHSRKASKREVAERIGRALERRTVPAAPPGGAPDVVERTRARCAAVHAALHTPVAPLCRSPFELVARGAALDDAPQVEAASPPQVPPTPAGLEAAREAAAALDRRRVRVPDPPSHPWRGLGRTRVEAALRTRILALLDELPARVSAVERAVAALAADLGVPPPTTPGEARAAVGAAAGLASASGLDASTTTDPAWRASGAALDRLASVLGALRTARRTASVVFRDDVVGGDDAGSVDWSDVAARRRATAGSPLRFLRPSFWSDARRLRRARRSDAPRDPAARTAALEALVEAGRLRLEAEEAGAPLAPLLQATWRGHRTDLDEFLARRDGAARAHAAREAGCVSAKALARLVEAEARDGLGRLAATARDALAGVGDWTARWLEALAATEASWFPGGADAVPFDALRSRHEALRAHVHDLEDAADLVEAERACEAAGLAAFVAWSETDAGRGALGRFADAAERWVLGHATEQALLASEVLARHRDDDHAAAVARFCEADRDALLANRARLTERLLARRPAAAAGESRETKVGLLRAQTRLKRGHLPIRRLLERAGDVVQAVTPCFLMSPLSVAHHLAPGSVAFDVVVFDEASQVEPADAIGAVARARQMVLFGDERQLPPTTFFARVEGGDDLEEPDEGAGAPPVAPAAGLLESVLSLAIARLPADHRAPLRWHYRSRDPSLVAFSNRHFYEGGLVTFPAPVARRTSCGVFLRRVASGGYRRGAGRSNPEEARAVAQAVMAHAREVARAGGEGPSLGVGAMSVAQQRAVEDEVERLRREDATQAAEAFFSTDREEPFFVKNLETIQGDERDVIFVSVGYGADAGGRLTMNFGPLNQSEGWRRLNVLVTRARSRVEVFSTLVASDLRVTDASPRGVRALRDYLAWAERGVADEDDERARRAPPAGVPGALARALARRGFVVHAPVGEGPGALDLAVVDPDRPDAYLLGVEGDGAAWRDAASVRDRDRLRPEVLARMGWRLERVGSVDWFRRPGAVVDRVVSRAEAARAGRDAGSATRGPAPAVPTTDPAPPRPAPASRAEEATPRPLAAPETVPYPVRPTRRLGDVDALLAARPPRAAAWIEEIVRREAPIHVEEALRALAAHFGARASARPREAFEAGLAHLLRRGGVTRRGAFLWAEGQTRAPVRRRGEDAAVTDPDLIAPEEFEEALRLTLAVEFGAPAEALLQATARRLGYARCGGRIRTALEAALDRLLASGEVAPDAQGDLVLRARPASGPRSHDPIA